MTSNMNGGKTNGGYSTENYNMEEQKDVKKAAAIGEEDDPFDGIAEFKSDETPWNELDGSGKVLRVILISIKVILLLGFLYLFICSLTFLSDAFRLLGGKSAGEAFKGDSIVNNYVAGLMIGMLATVLLQSSSTTTSIVISMVGSEILGVRPGIPMVMGANIGTSVTNTIVSLGQIGDKDQFRRAFAGATVHDVFNLLSVVILLPLEAITGYLYHLSKAIVNSIDHSEDSKSYKQDLLKKVTKPFTDLIIRLDKKIITKIATGEKVDDDVSLVKYWCDTGKSVTSEVNVTENGNVTLKNVTEKVYSEKCKFLFFDTGMSDKVIGIIMLLLSLFILLSCLLMMVKLLHSLMKGGMASAIKKSLNAKFRKPFTFLSGYIAIFVGAGVTMVLQSSSVFTSALTPIVGMGIVKLERIYPLTLGANVGTTFTGILAALAASPSSFKNSLQIAMCHLFFNISGIILWYPIPFMRRIPIKLARILGNTTAEYRWFAIFYLICMFFIIPGAIFGLSFAGVIAFCVVLVPIALLIVVVVILNIMQDKKPEYLPRKLQDWEFLPLGMRSLEPYDRIITTVYSKVRRNKDDENEKHEMRKS